MKLDNKGSSLVEITAGFLMLVVIMASFIKIINLSSEMTDTAVDMKNSNLEFNKRYYTGYNYTVNDGTAFRAGGGETVEFHDDDNAIVPLKLTEWHRQSDGDYFEEWNENTDFKIVYSSNNETITLNNITLYHIENVKDYDMARIGLYRYRYDSP